MRCKYCNIQLRYPTESSYCQSCQEDNQDEKDRQKVVTNHTICPTIGEVCYSSTPCNKCPYK